MPRYNYSLAVGPILILDWSEASSKGQSTQTNVCDGINLIGVHDDSKPSFPSYTSRNELSNGQDFTR